VPAAREPVVIEFESETEADADCLRPSREEPEKESVETEDEGAAIEVSSAAISKSIRSMVSCEFPLGITRVSFSFLMIIS